MTTLVTVTNKNQGAPFADWDVELVIDGKVEHTLKPGESKSVTLWHDGRELAVREKQRVST